jgi:hypothetical protein
MAGLRLSRIFDLAKHFTLREGSVVNSFIAPNCLLIALVSCGWDSESQPSESGPSALLNKFSGEMESMKVDGEAEFHKKKAFSGRVTFQGLTDFQLSQIRVIPESGSLLIEPSNESYDQVDGLWVMGAQSDKWFKIPDHSEAWVGKEPINFEGTAHLRFLKIYYRSSPILHFAGAMRKGLKNPGWVSNFGLTKSPVPAPW